MSNKAVKVPGEQEPEQQADETINVSKSALAALVAGEVAKAVAQARVKPARSNEPDLPRMADLDIATITEPTLTRDGWYVPVGAHSNPAAPK